MAEHRSIVGTYDNRATADIIANELSQHGFSSRDIEILDGAGAADGNTRERLLAWGIPNDDADLYAREMEAGHSVVVVDAKDNEVDEAVRIMRREGAEAARAPRKGRRGREASSKIPVVEEEMHVGKERVETGGVRVVHRTSERPVSADVELRDEEIFVERHATDRPVSSGDLDAAREGGIELTESEERPVVTKSAHVVEEVEVGKRTTSHTEHIEDTVRRDDVDVEKIPKRDRPDAHP